MIASPYRSSRRSRGSVTVLVPEPSESADLDVGSGLSTEVAADAVFVTRADEATEVAVTSVTTGANEIESCVSNQQSAMGTTRKKHELRTWLLEEFGCAVTVTPTPWSGESAAGISPRERRPVLTGSHTAPDSCGGAVRAPVQDAPGISTVVADVDVVCGSSRHAPAMSSRTSTRSGTGFSAAKGTSTALTIGGQQRWGGRDTVHPQCARVLIRVQRRTNTPRTKYHASLLGPRLAAASTATWPAPSPIRLPGPRQARPELRARAAASCRVAIQVPVSFLVAVRSLV
ncbi:hypothetical protein L226DRAFT_61831 [Lentinus tigrinus ALCF2SS1-7]|uniref:uncharacterized protein n=1 Tax=Lentinus tigrinus ALCF2SS1-7 TaxID=1328758 RepID=UPI001165F4A6|nr:hypothetical protein L226DRAFT_61831 [Lentinus tigrinus ALCF2SS1-7]